MLELARYVYQMWKVEFRPVVLMVQGAVLAGFECQDDDQSGRVEFIFIAVMLWPAWLMWSWRSSVIPGSGRSGICR